MAFPTTGLLDDFTGAAGADANFTEIDGGTSFTGVNYDGSGNGGSASPTTKFAYAYYNPSTYGPDSECYATVSNVGTASNAIRVGARYAAVGTTSFTGYYVQGQLQTAAAWTIVRKDAGSSTTLATAGSTQVLNVGDKIGIEIVGTVINAWYFNTSNSTWTKILTYDTSGDATKYSAAGNLAIEFGFHTSKITDFNGGTVVTGGATDNISFSVSSSSSVAFTLGGMTDPVGLTVASASTVTFGVGTGPPIDHIAFAVLSGSSVSFIPGGMSDLIPILIASGSSPLFGLQDLFGSSGFSPALHGGRFFRR